LPRNAAYVEADVVDVGLDFLTPRLQISDRSLQRLHSIITLITDLDQPDELEVDHPLLQI
jgi:hypothetical protein